MITRKQYKILKQISKFDYCESEIFSEGNLFDSELPTLFAQGLVEYIQSNDEVEYYTYKQDKYVAITGSGRQAIDEYRRFVKNAIKNDLAIIAGILTVIATIMPLLQSR